MLTRAVRGRPLGSRVFSSALVLAMVALNPASGEEPAPAKVGRFAVIPSPVRAFSAVVMIDTTTGECWKGGELTEPGPFQLQWQSLDFPAKGTNVERGEIGRFRITSFSESVGGRGCLLVTDTVDGRGWFLRAGADKWVPAPAPPRK